MIVPSSSNLACPQGFKPAFAGTRIFLRLSQPTMICGSIRVFYFRRVIKMKRASGLLIALALILVGVNAVAKTGVVDLQKIVQNSSQMKAIQQKLENKFKPRRDKLVAMEESLRQDMEKFKRDSSVMSETQKKDAERKILATEQTFKREGQQYQEELNTANDEEMENLYGKIRQAIASVANAEKYEIILQKDAAPFSSDKLDITDSVIKRLG